MSKLIYRKGDLSDQPALQRLGIVSYGQFRDVLSAADWQTMYDFLHNDAMWTQLVSVAQIFVCEENGKLVGMAYLVPSGHPTHIYPADWCYVRMVGVDPAYRGKGIGKKLTQLCVDHARETKEKTVGLHTSEKMDDARHIYERIGFVIDKELAPIYGMRYWLYRLDLTSSTMDSLSFQIVPFIPAIHQAGTSLLYEAIKDEFPENMFGNPPKTLAELSALPGRHYWVTLNDGRVTGTIGIAVLNDANCALKGMFLAKELRGTNAAKAMLQKAIDAAMEKGCKAMYLGTMSQFKAAQRFYEKLGFDAIQADQLPADFPANAVDTVFYYKKLI